MIAFEKSDLECLRVLKKCIFDYIHVLRSNPFLACFTNVSFVAKIFKRWRKLITAIMF